LRRHLLARLTLLLGLLCMVSQLSGELHWALVEHQRCADHGEWIHEGDHHHAGSEEAAAPAPLSVTSPDDDAHDHDHCQVLTDRRELGLAPSATTPLEAPAAHAVTGLERATPVVAASALYRLAPKTSPPC
jgi:hypothetical protein